MSIALLNTDQLEELISVPLPRLRPGCIDEKKLGVKNNYSSDLVNLRLAVWPDMKNGTFINTSGSPIVSAGVLVEENQEKKTTSVTRDTSDGLLSKRTTRDPVIRYDSGSTNYYEYHPTGDVVMMAAADDYVYFGFEVPCRNLYCEIKTVGSYGTLSWEKSTSGGWASFTPTDNTSGFTVDGNIDLASGIATGWVRSTVYGVTCYWIRVKAASVTTQAELDVCYPNFIYELPKCCLLGKGDYYTYDGSSNYTAAPPDFEYANQGLIAYNSDPLTSDTQVRANYTCKDPQPGVYNLTFSQSGSQWQCSVNGGAAVDVTANNSYVNKNIISGMGIVLSSSIATSNTATVPICESVKHFWYAQDSGGSADTYENNDITLTASLPSDSSHPFWLKREPFTTADVSDDYYFKFLFYEN